MTWQQNPGGALLAIRDVLRSGIDAQMVAKNAQITTEGLGYSIPDSVDNNNIRIRQTVFRVLPQNSPAIQVKYVDRLVTPTTSIGLATTNPEFELHYWLSGNDFSTLADELDSEEVLSLAALDFGDAILKTLRSLADGVYGEAGGSIGDVDETSQTYLEAYFDEQFGTFTIEGRLRVRLIQDAEY